MLLQHSASEFNVRVQRTLKTLPKDRLEIILLYYFLGMNDPEIAAHLNLLRRTVAYRRTSSLQELKKFMEGNADE